MAITQYAGGNKTGMTLNVEAALSSDPDTTDGVFQFFLDVSNMAASDVLHIYIKEKAQAAGDTQRIIIDATLSNAQTNEPMWVSPTFILMWGWTYSIKQTAGTQRDYKWSIRQAG